MAEKLKQIWLQLDRASAEKLAALIIEEYEKKYPEAMRCLDDRLEHSLQFYNFPEIDKRRISSTYIFERTNRVIRRTSPVVAVFPSVESYLRLSVSNLMEHTEDWSNYYAYIKAENLSPILRMTWLNWPIKKEKIERLRWGNCRQNLTWPAYLYFLFILNFFYLTK